MKTNRVARCSGGGRLAFALAVMVLGSGVSTAALAQAKDGARFRGGVSLGGGGLFVSGFSAGMGGIDGRLGVQINNLIGIYAQPHLSLGAGKVGSATGFTGALGGTAVVDFTLFDRMFVGAGGGGSVVGSLGGGVVHVRLGGYPLVARGEDGVRRKGLMVGADLRVYVFSVGTVMEVFGSIGYEAF